MTKNHFKQKLLLFMKINLIQVIMAGVFAINAFAIPAKAQDALQQKVSIMHSVLITKLVNFGQKKLKMINIYYILH